LQAEGREPDAADGPQGASLPFERLDVQLDERAELQPVIRAARDAVDAASRVRPEIVIGVDELLEVDPDVAGGVEVVKHRLEHLLAGGRDDFHGVLPEKKGPPRA